MSGRKWLVAFALQWLAAILAVCACVVSGAIVFWVIGGFLYHRGIIDDATLFIFPLYGVLPGFVLGFVCYATISIGRQHSA